MWPFWFVTWPHQRCTAALGDTIIHLNKTGTKIDSITVDNESSGITEVWIYQGDTLLRSCVMSLHNQSQTFTLSQSVEADDTISIASSWRPQ